MSYELPADEILVKLLNASDEKAFRLIYERYWKKLFFIAYSKTSSKESAEEIVQDIFTSLWEKRNKLKIERLENYLVTAVKYKVISYIESKLVKESKQSKLRIADYDDHTDEQIALRDLNNALHEGIGLLPDKTKEIFILSRIEKTSVKEIAAQMNLSEKAVEYHITRSLKLMRTHLKDFIAFEIITLLIK